MKELPNAKHIQMFNLGNPNPYKTRDSEYYYVEESAIIGDVVVGRTVIFDATKYAVYKFIGYSKGKTLVPSDHLWVKGYVNNIVNVQDYAGPFFNFAEGIGPFGYSASVGYNKD